MNTAYPMIYLWIVVISFLGAFAYLLWRAGKMTDEDNERRRLKKQQKKEKKMLARMNSGQP